MSHLHLPARHTDEDLALAGCLAQMLHSGELYVAWSTDGGAARPVIPATVHAHAERPLPPPGPEPSPVRRRDLLARWRRRKRGGA